MQNNSIEQHKLDSSFGELCWFEWNKAEAGPILLLLHATGFHARIWDQIIAQLPADVHVVAPDLLGHGRSFKPDSMSSWTDCSLSLLPLVDKFRGRPIIGAGHSMGGYILSRLAAERPDAFQKILMIDPVILPEETYIGDELPVLDPADHPVSRRRNSWESPEQMLANFREKRPYSTWDEAVLADYCRYGLLPEDDGSGFHLACPPRVEASIYQNANRANPFEWLQDITAESFVLRAKQGERKGDLDFSSSPTWPGLAGEILRGQDISWPEYTHFIPMEAPQETAQLLEDLIKG